MRIHAISDLHTDFAANLLIIEGLSKSAYRDDVLLVAGDIGDRLETISHTLAVLRERFAKVFYVPGNHELWVRADTTATDCVGLDVHTTPGRAGGLWIVPLLSWYEAEFDSGNEHESSLKAWADFYFCKWPKSMRSVCDHFTNLNASRIRRYDGKVISLSHFLPRRDLLPPTELLRFKGLPQVAGCERLETQIRELGSIAHVFGHSHINCDRVINGVRYVQNALRYPSERGSRPFSLKTVWPLDDVEQGAENSTGIIQSV
jgi:predicted phosphodiesterase